MTACLGQNAMRYKSFQCDADETMEMARRFLAEILTWLDKNCWDDKSISDIA